MDWDKLTKECPLLYRNTISFDCQDGWFDLIANLSYKLEKLIAEQEAKYPDAEIKMYAEQVKEKFGALRFYMSSATNDMFNLIDEAECLSSKTCDLCGKEGKMNNNTGWIRTLCKEHWRMGAKRQREYDE